MTVSPIAGDSATETAISAAKIVRIRAMLSVSHYSK
jgi:hypothetical protein